MLKQKEWIDVLVGKLNCTKKDAKAYYDCVFDSIREQVSPEDPVKISGFGVFKIRKTAAKEQVNLVTGETVIVPEHNVVVFKPYFEIEPKPEAIEVEVDSATPVETTESTVAVETETEDENVVEEVEEEEETVVEETKDEVTEPVEEAKEEVVTDSDNIVWVYEGKECSTSNMKQVLRQKTTLSDDDIDAAIDVVKKNVVGSGKVEVKEENETFDFVIAK